MSDQNDAAKTRKSYRAIVLLILLVIVSVIAFCIYLMKTETPPNPERLIYPGRHAVKHWESRRAPPFSPSPNLSRALPKS